MRARSLDWKEVTFTKAVEFAQGRTVLKRGRKNRTFARRDGERPDYVRFTDGSAVACLSKGDCGDPDYDASFNADTPEFYVYEPKPRPKPQANYANAVARMWERSIKLRREVEAKGPMKEVYAIHCHVGSIEMFEDAEGVFWLDMDGDFQRAEGWYMGLPDRVGMMRSKGVSEETIQRVVKQCEPVDATREGR